MQCNSLQLTLVARLRVDIEDVVVLSVWVFGGVPVVDVDVDSVSAIETLSSRAL